MTATAFSKHVLTIDCHREAGSIERCIRETVLRQFRKRGAVVALSGGIDSSVVGALCVRALGKEHVLGLLMPEKESSTETAALSRLIAAFLDITVIEDDITCALEAVGCYRRRDEAIRTLIPEYGPGYTCKIVLPDLVNGSEFRFFSVVVMSPEGRSLKARVTAGAFREIVAATNFKQRIRKVLEYYHADRVNFAVAGTPNRQEYDQGFFVKLGDGAADIKPIAHLYKTQVYQMASFLGIPAEIRNRLPTTDTYSMEQSQEEFFFSVPYDTMDICLYGKNNGISAADIASATDLTDVQVGRIYRDIDRKRRATQYLHAESVLVEAVDEIRRGPG